MDSLFKATETTNPRGIPQAPFVADVGALVKDRSDFDMVFGKFQERLAMYKYMQESKTANLKQLQVRVPDIENTLKMCRLLKQNKDDACLEVNYQLNDTLFTRAQVPRGTDTVGLWLGADVMLEYPVQEAIALLQQKLRDSKASLQVCHEDIEFLRENITTMEVNCARLYNWDVEMRNKQQQQQHSTESASIEAK